MIFSAKQDKFFISNHCSDDLCIVMKSGRLSHKLYLLYLYICKLQERFACHKHLRLKEFLNPGFPEYLKSLQCVSFGYASMVSMCCMLSFKRFHSVSQGWYRHLLCLGLWLTCIFDFLISKAAVSKEQQKWWAWIYLAKLVYVSDSSLNSPETVRNMIVCVWDVRCVVATVERLCAF